MLVLQRGKFTERDSEISRVLARTASLFPRFFIPRYVSPELFSSSFSPSFLSSSFSLFISRFLVAFCDVSQGRGIVIKSELWARAGQLDSDHATGECLDSPTSKNVQLVRACTSIFFGLSATCSLARSRVNRITRSIGINS